jgi:hypothetical protein
VGDAKSWQNKLKFERIVEKRHDRRRGRAAVEQKKGDPEQPGQGRICATCLLYSRPKPQLSGASEKHRDDVVIVGSLPQALCTLGK